MNVETVRNLIAETLGCDVEQVVDEAVLVDDLGADSLAIVELTMALEESTGISIDDEALGQIKTVADVLNYLENHAK
jgi:acyl carrier protein